MKNLLPVLLFTLVASGFAATVYQNEEDYTSMFFAQFQNDFKVQSEEALRPQLQITENDFKFFLFNKNKESQELNISNAEDVKQSNYSPQKNTVFIIHGWTNDHLSNMSQTVAKAYTAVTDMNVFVVDWSRVAKQIYVQARNQVVQVGNVLGKMISSMVENNLLNLEKTSIVGHSLGAHVAGTTGKALNGQVDHIIGLDPAGPLFFLQVSRDRLDKTDAKFVQILHTNAGKLGFAESLGHADFWPNGGKAQPGCTAESDVLGLCSHGRAFKLYAESLISGRFYSWKCKDYETFKIGGCRNGLEAHFGQLNINKLANGNFYLDTNAVSPFAKGGKY